MCSEKLIRDRIIDIALKKGQNIQYRIAKKVEYKALLIKKLKEEVEEFIKDQNEEEIADILTVIDSIEQAFTFRNSTKQNTNYNVISHISKQWECDHLKKATDEFLNYSSLEKYNEIIEITYSIIHIYKF